MKKKEDKRAEIDIIEMLDGRVTFCVLGETPFVCESMSSKAKHELVFPGGKTRADRASRLKHDPMQEFRDSFYRSRNESEPTLIQLVASSFKNAMASAALDVPGVAKRQVERLLWVEGERLPLYGIPSLAMHVTRSADMNKTPDIRTRAFIRDWACKVTVRYAVPTLNAKSVTNLLAMAGRRIGVGGWRNEKGKGTFGQFSLVAEDDPRFTHITTHATRAAQLSAAQSPGFYDEDAEELYRWFESEIAERGKEAMLKSRANGASHEEVVS